MKIADITETDVKQMAVPSSAYIILKDALARVVDDGRQALAGNKDAADATKANLNLCGACASVHNQGLHVIDGDAWERFAHPQMKNRDCSVDFALLLEQDSDRFLLPVEAKLGLAFEYPGDKAGSSISLEYLQAKYKGFLSLIKSGAVAISGKLVLLVPKDGQEWMWYRVREWNRLESAVGKILSCCVDDFFRIVGLGSGEKRCDGDDIRYDRLRQEFISAAKMSPIQLAPIVDCTACGECKRVCRKRAISMIPNDEVGGEKRPFVDTVSCNRCGYCEQVCPVLVRHRQSLGLQ